MSHLINWEQDFRVATENRGSSADLSRLASELRPFSLPYFSPLRPLFLLDPTWDPGVPGSSLFVRDGLIPVLWFFHEQSARRFPQHLVLHVDLAPFVPEEWREKVSFYRIESISSGSNPDRPRSDLVLVGVANPDYCTLDSLRRFCHRAKEAVSSDSFPVRTSVFLPVRKQLGTQFFDPHYFWEYSRTIFESFGFDMTFIPESRLDHFQPEPGLVLCDLSDGFLLKDSYPLHCFLSKGAILIENGAAQSILAKTERRIPLSPFHELRLFEGYSGSLGADLEEAMELKAFRKEFEDRTPPDWDLPWPFWFDVACRTVAGLKNG